LTIHGCLLGCYFENEYDGEGREENPTIWTKFLLYELEDFVAKVDPILENK
jgi:hypothetical protein